MITLELVRINHLILVNLLIVKVYRDSIGNAGESVESAETVMEESTDSLVENSKQGMELDVKENPDKRMELDVKESAKTVMEESTGNAGESVESAKTVMEESTDSLEENPDKRMVLDVKYQTRQSARLVELDVKENPDKRMGLDVKYQVRRSSGYGILEFIRS
ncbi:uncharacterized protein LOC113310942 isoform X4 [Papaver somniferum]|uniref:uncharacterized protein LOC113310942 isoform X4 n=1 Tax=Papaver somniferum TaxID=3469 RepID=UPI000E6F9ACC|nr:uncharacterized protein LOC113310942 isoform X4 [Papaver somniferum]